MAERVAKVKIKNQSEEKIISVGVIHKYSNIYKDVLQFGQIEVDGEASASNNAEVHYRTGMGEIGLDWWFVYWFTEESESQVKFHMSAPNNLREMADFLDKAIPDILKLVSAGTAISTLAAPELLTKTISAIITLTTTTLSYVVSKTMNQEPTTGFKEHMLVKEDAGKETFICIGRDGKIEFCSPSGISKTQAKETITACVVTVELSPEGKIVVRE